MLAFKIYLPQVKKILPFFIFFLLVFLLFIALAYQATEEKILIFTGLASVVVLVIPVFEYLKKEWMFRREETNHEEAVNGQNVDFFEQLSETLSEFHNLSSEVAVLVGKMKHRMIDRPTMKEGILRLVEEKSEVVRKFLLTEVFIHQNSEVVCLGETAKLMESILTYYRKGERHKILIIPCLIFDKRIINLIRQYNPSLIVTLFCEENFNIKGCKIISMFCLYKTIQDALWAKEYVL